MLCQKCGKNTATVHYKQIINGAVYEEYLCTECADKTNKGFTLDGGFDELFGKLFGSYRTSSELKSPKACPLCGSTIRDISNSGKVGCAKCYEVFREELMPTVTGIHGNVTHIGRTPGNHREMMEKQAKINELKARQQKAVEEQDYELAAQLRDEIKAIENELDNTSSSSSDKSSENNE